MTNSLADQLRMLAAEVERTATAQNPDHSNAKKLTRSEVLQMRREYRNGLMTQRDLADTYGINPATVSRIVRGIYHGNIR